MRQGINWMQKLCRTGRTGLVRMAVLTVILATMLPRQVSADLVYEPEDSFYEQHSQECEYENRTYRANGPDGELIVYKSPENSAIQERIENGTNIYISYVYTDKNGITWGIIDDWSQDISGWIPMEYVSEIYDNVYFMKHYAQAIIEEYGDISYIPPEENCLAWAYPGAKNPTEFYINHDNTDFYPSYYRTFTDECGHVWGLIGYYYGQRDEWICLDAPSASYEELYGDNPPVRELENQATIYSSTDIRPESTRTNRIAIWSCILVAGVVIVTAVLLLLFYSRAKRNENKNEKK